MFIDDAEQPPLSDRETALAAALAPDFGAAQLRLLRRPRQERRRERLASLAAMIEACGWGAVGTLAATAVLMVTALGRR